jgi:hypothetical protein
MFQTLIDPAFLAFENGGTPALDLFFSATKALDSRITFTRASSGTFIDSAGLVRTASTNVARFTHNPVTLESQGLLIEESRTNLLLRSEEFDNASWVKPDTVVTANEDTAPDGTLTADLITEGTAGTALVSQAVTISSGATITASCFLKRGNYDWLRLRIDNGANGVNAWVNLATGAVGTVTALGVATGASCVLKESVGGYYRFAVTITIPLAVSVSFLFISASGNKSTSRVNNGTRYQWGAQLEAGAFASSYIATTGASADRAADVAVMTGTDFSQWYNQTQGTLIVESLSPASGDRTIVAMDDNTANEMIRLRTEGNDPFFRVDDGGASQCALDAGSITASTSFRLAGAYSANDFAACVNGGTVQTDSAGTIPAVDRMRIGAGQAGNTVTAPIARIRYYRRRLPDASLQLLTT